MENSNINSNFIIQIGFLVKDINKVARNWADFLNQPVPKIRLNNPYSITEAIYNEKPCPARIYQTSFELNNLQIELISPADNKPSFWKDCLDRDGEGIHHIAFSIRNKNDVANKMERQDMPQVQTGKFQGGSYTFFDSFEKLKIYVEGLSIDTIPKDLFEKTNPLIKHK